MSMTSPCMRRDSAFLVALPLLPPLLFLLSCLFLSGGLVDFPFPGFSGVFL